MTTHRKFWILSIANWLLAGVAWAISAYLGIARPTSLFIPTTLFVIGLFAVLAGVLCWVAARFGQDPEAATASAPATSRVVTVAVGESTTSSAAEVEATAASSDEPEPSPDEAVPAEAG